MDIKQLHYFVTIVDEGNITAAARKLFMSQPPLSNQIKLLEDELVCTLFERGARAVHLTDAGKTLYQYACSILELNQVAKTQTMISAKKHNETVRIGIVSSVICSSALDWISGFSIEHPDIHFEIIEGNTYELIQKFESDLIHLAILRTPFNKENLTCNKIYTDQLVAIGKPKYFTNTRNPDCTTLEELSKQPLIIYRRWEKIIKDKFDEQHLMMSCSCINDDARTTLYFVESSMGIGLLPESAVKSSNSDFITKRISDCSISSDVVLTYNATSYLPDCSKQFIDYVLKQANEKPTTIM